MSNELILLYCNAQYLLSSHIRVHYQCQKYIPQTV